MPNREIPLEEIAAAMPLARAYCEPECQTRVMDSDLVYAAARLLIREGWVPPESAMVEAIDVSNPVSPSMRPKEVRPKVKDWARLRGESYEQLDICPACKLSFRNWKECRE